MFPLDIQMEQFIPFLIFAIPIIAIVGGITAGIVKTIGHQRIIELAHRERIAAIERGLDPAKLPPLPGATGSDLAEGYFSPVSQGRRLSQGLFIGGLVMVAVAIGLGIFLSQVTHHDSVWSVSLIPGLVGVALLISSQVVRPKESERIGNPPAPLS